MSAQNTAQTTPNVGSTSAGPARASPSAVLTARFPSQASEQANQNAQLLALAAAAQSVDPTKHWAHILLPAAEMNVNPLSGVMDTPEARRGLFDFVIRPNYGYEQLLTVDLPLPNMWSGCTAKVALCYSSDMKQSHTGPTAGLVCRTVHMRIAFLDEEVPTREPFPAPYGDLTPTGEVAETDMTLLTHCPKVIGDWHTLKTPEFCTDNFFKNSSNRSLTVDNVWNTYEDLCKTLRRYQQNGICHHVKNYLTYDAVYGGHRVHKFYMCTHEAWFKGCCYCVQHQHDEHIAKKRRIDED